MKATPMTRSRPEAPVADHTRQKDVDARRDEDDMTEVPLPTGETDAERRRIRSSNDRDQELEREGVESPHNRGYDEAADGRPPSPDIERVVDE
jgi:hypothetical protein